MYQENQYFVKNMLLLKNPQFLPNHYKFLWKWGTHDYLIFTKFRNDWDKIVDFLIKAYFWQSIDSPDTQCIGFQNLKHSCFRPNNIKCPLQGMSRRQWYTRTVPFNRKLILKQSGFFTKNLILNYIKHWKTYLIFQTKSYSENQVL